MALQDALSSNHALRMAGTRDRLAEKVRRVLQAGLTGPTRVEVPVGRAGLLEWLCAQPTPRGFWGGRGGGRAAAFAGVADRHEDPGRLDDLLRARAGHAPDLRYYGGGRFDPERPAGDGWEPFGPRAFVLPRFELVAKGTETVLACHLVPSDEEADLLRKIEQIALPGRGSATPRLPRPVDRHDTPDRSGWDERVEAALAAFRSASLDKVVLARRTTFAFSEALDPVELFRRLRTETSGCFHFLFEPSKGYAFLGASPERLFRQQGRAIESEALAGTRPRGASPDADAALRNELLESEKDRREHAFVRRFIRERLETCCTAVEEKNTEALALARGQHLRVGLQGRLRSGVGPADVLQALHPTPAVGGAPPAAALAFIRAHESFDRGWYAAPVGWIGLEDGTPAAELAVGIRSGRLRGKRLALFSGAGLVEGSVPEKEWAEVEQKLSNFTEGLGLASKR